MTNGLKQYMPSLGMVLATVLSTLYIALGDNKIDSSEWFMVTTSGLGAFTVYVVPRIAGVQWLKPAVAGLTAVFSAGGAAVITPGISAQEWVVMGIQGLAGLGIVMATNSEVPLTPPGDPSSVREQASG